MKDDMKDFDLENLWQSEKGEIDMDMIMQHVQRGERLGARFRVILYGFYALSLALTGFLEWSGVYGTGGLLSAVLFLAYALGIFRMHRGRPDFAILTPLEQLQYSLRRAKNNLAIVRVLAVYLPILFVGAIGAGYIAGKVMGPSSSPTLSGDAVWILLVCVLISLSIITAVGNRLAAKFRLEIAALEDRLTFFERNE